MIVVGIAGRKRHGKDTLVDILRHRWDFKVMRFADPLKDMMRELYRHAGITPAATEDRITDSLKEDPDHALMGATPRWAMQSLGTEWRDALNPPMSRKLWSTILLNKIMTRESKDSRIVVPDLRFPHELDALKRASAVTIRVHRPALALQDAENNHPSEALVDTLEVDHVIPNTGTLDSFQHTAIQKMEMILNGRF